MPLCLRQIESELASCERELIFLGPPADNSFQWGIRLERGVAYSRSMNKLTDVFKTPPSIPTWDTAFVSGPELLGEFNAFLEVCVFDSVQSWHTHSGFTKQVKCVMKCNMSRFDGYTDTKFDFREFEVLFNVANYKEAEGKMVVVYDSTNASYTRY
jgi:hypothetical protein